METTEKKKKEYQQAVKVLSPNSHIIKNCIWAFFSGGTICLIGHILRRIFEALNYSEDKTALLVDLILIASSALLTGLGLYSKMGKKCGAGTVVPITGFANSMVSPSIEYKTQGFILGLGAKMFTVAGPVLVYGITTSVIVGIIHYFIMG